MRRGIPSTWWRQGWEFRIRSSVCRPIRSFFVSKRAKERFANEKEWREQIAQNRSEERFWEKVQRANERKSEFPTLDGGELRAVGGWGGEDHGPGHRLHGQPHPHRQLRAGVPPFPLQVRQPPGKLYPIFLYLIFSSSLNNLLQLIIFKGCSNEIKSFWGIYKNSILTTMHHVIADICTSCTP